MALTEIQLPTKADFYRDIQSIATEVDRIMTRLANVSEFNASLQTADLDAMGIPVGQVRTDLVDFRVAIEDMVDFYKGTVVTATNAPDSIMDKLRHMT